MATTGVGRANHDSPLLDQFGRPMATLIRPDPERITLASIRDLWYAYPAQGLRPETLATILKEADHGYVWRQAELFEEMLERDAKMFSLFQTRAMSVEGLQWRIDPADESGPAKQIAEELTERLEAMPLGRVIRSLLVAIPYGYAATELLWMRYGNDLAIHDVVDVPIRRLTWLPYAGQPMPDVPRVITDQEPVFGVEMPAFKFAVHRYLARGGAITRAGLMRTCAWLYLFKHYGLKDWVAFAEVYGMPLRLGKYQPGASQDDRDALLAAVRAIGHDAAGIISSSTEIEFAEATQAGRGTNPYEALINMVNKELAQAILGQTLTSDVGTVGSLAAAQVHDEVRFDLTAADATALAETITQQILRPLVGFNHGWDVPVPRFAFKIEKPRDQGKEATALKTLVEAGFGPAIPLAVAQERFGIRPPKDGEATVGGGPTPVNPPPVIAREHRDRSNLTVVPSKDGQIAAHPVGARNDRQEALAATGPLADYLTDQEWQRTIVPLLSPIHKLAQEAQTLTEFRDRLTECYREADPELLARAMTMAMQWGWIHAGA